MASTLGLNAGTRLMDTSEVASEGNIKLTALNATTGTLAANLITGGVFVCMITTNATPGTQTTRTALQLFGDDPTAIIGNGYILRICNSGAGTLTLAGGTGVTVTGTATVATTTSRDFACVWSGTIAAPLLTITNIGLATYT